MFALMHSSRVESLHLVVDPETGLKAVIAIDNCRHGPALGGCRYLSYADEESAIADAIRLARSMSYKAVLAGLPQENTARCFRGRAVDIGRARSAVFAAAD